jgi:hypothetical protein
MRLRYQLELGIDTSSPRCPAPRQRRRVERARWWFEQMRRAVNEAPDPAGSPGGTVAPVPARP